MWAFDLSRIFRLERFSSGGGGKKSLEMLYILMIMQSCVISMVDTHPLQINLGVESHMYSKLACMIAKYIRLMGYIMI